MYYACIMFLNFPLLIQISVVHVEGTSLLLHKVSRLDMGAYMCIATNGVPPTISKRIQLNVDCKYTNPIINFKT